MGVTGLWRLLAPVGKPVTLESLEGKILAVDVSIWLNKAAKGMRDKHGNTIYNAHLVLMFHRICKLLFYGIKPVFVFDGSVPELKKKTLKARRERKTQAETRKSKTKQKMLKNYLHAKALETVTGMKSSFKLNTKKKEADMFELPPEPLNPPSRHSQSDSSSDDDVLNEEEWLKTLNENHIQAMFDKPSSVDIESEEFKALPAEVKHELLTEIKDSHRRRYREKNLENVQLPEEANNFSSFQLDNLMKRGRITQQIDQLRKDMNSSMTAQFIQLYNEDLGRLNFHSKSVESKQYASNEKKRYFLIKKVKKASKDENVLFQTSLDDDYIRFKQREGTHVDEETEGIFQKLERPAAKFQMIVNENFKRKRFDSDSSEELNEILPLKKPMVEDIPSQTAAETISKDNVEYMSDSSSSSEEESSNKHPDKSVEEGKEYIDFDSLNNSSTDLLNRESSVICLDLNIPSIQKTDTNAIDYSLDTSTSVKVNSPTKSDVQISNEKLQVETSADEDYFLHTTDINQVVKSSNVIPDAEEPDLREKSILLNTTPKDHPTAEQITESNMSSNSTTPLISPTSVADTYELSTIDSNIMPKTLTNKDPEGNVLITGIEEKPCTSKSEVSKTITKDKAISIQQQLATEQQRLEQDTLKQTRQAATLSSEMYKDVQDLLQLFGIPYLVSPAEAEAQCAQLDYSNLTNGSITDDSDIFLFGASNVYKNIFNQHRYAECYISKNIEKNLYLTREKLIGVAFLTGSDYTEGVPGIGGITAMEILHEFSRDKAKDTLKFFKKWIKSNGANEFVPGSNLKAKLSDIQLPTTFNSSAVWDAYLSPSVDTSDERFEWGEPDVAAIKEFANEKFGWLYSRTTEALEPVLEKIGRRREKQMTLKAYFKPAAKINENSTITSKRLQKILKRISSPDIPVAEQPSSSKSKSVATSGEDYFHDTSIDSALLDLETTEVDLGECSSGSSSNWKSLYSKCIVKRDQTKPFSTTSQQNHQDKQQQQDPQNQHEQYRSQTQKKPQKPRQNSMVSTVSSNEKVQAKKVENLMKAATESMKAPSPFIEMQNVNKLVNSKLFGSKGRKVHRSTTKLKKQKAALALMKKAEAMRSKSELRPLESSESDSD